jgi:hypothetical protein
VLVACVGLGACLAGQASAEVSHIYSHSFGSALSSPANPYPLAAPSDVAVDQLNGDIYVTDAGNYRVEKFDSAGNFILMFGKGVNLTTGGDVCPVAPTDVCQPGTSSSAPGGFKGPVALAVDRYPGGNGDVYVADEKVVQKFTSAGHVISGWGAAGQKDGSDATDLAVFGTLFAVAVGGGCSTPEKPLTGACKANGTLYVGGSNYSSRVWAYTQSGQYIKWFGILPGSGKSFEVDAEGNMYFSESGNFSPYKGQALKGIPLLGDYERVTAYVMGGDRPTTALALDPGTHELYQGTGTRMVGATKVHGPRISHYDNHCNPPQTAECEQPDDTFGEGEMEEATGLDVDDDSHDVYVAKSNDNAIAVYVDVRPKVTTGAPADVTDTSVTLIGTVSPAGPGAISECYFEYGFDTTYGHTIPCEPDPAANPPGSNFTESTSVTATLSGMSPGTVEHYRLVAFSTADSHGAGKDRVFRTTSAPTIIALQSENLTATTADLSGIVNPNGLDTTYRFEYGPTIDYGQTAPRPDGVLTASNEGQSVKVHLENLTPHVVYHYRLVAENTSGVSTVEDHTFNFYPPACPNENVRQQTKANFLPDCRAYELVSPADAAGTQLFPFGPNTGYATSPSRFSYTGSFSTIPEAGGKPIDGSGDLYVATRTPTGWHTRYVGWPADEASLVGGPPMGPPGSAPSYLSIPAILAGTDPLEGQNSVLTDLGMSRFLSFNEGSQSVGSAFSYDFANRTPIASNAPRVYSADGDYLGRWPSNLASVPDGSYPHESNFITHGGYFIPGEELTDVAPGGTRSLNCPSIYVGNENLDGIAANNCPGDVTASADLSHFVFASRWNVFAPGGQLDAPGSVYDYDTETGTVVVASRLPGLIGEPGNGPPIPSEPGNESGDVLQIPAVSKDGSHILIAAGGTGGCGAAVCPRMPCGYGSYNVVRRCPMQLSHLYMRVDRTLTYDVSKGHLVDYVGTSADATRVYFLSDQQLISDDEDSSTDLYQWDEETNELTLVSKPDVAGGPGGPGNSDTCKGGLVTQHNEETTKCGVATYTQWYVCSQTMEKAGGNCLSDKAIASESGDIYFLSQEQLEGSRGIPNVPNLYVFRNGHVQYVTTFTGSPDCLNTEVGSFCTPIIRMQVTPNGKYMSFVTSSPITQYDNALHKEMYRYTPDTRELVCVSCIPDGSEPTTDVLASQNGLFMTNDGRAFFSTEDPLVHSDTNRAQDVYEYVDGRPQLITLGTGDTRIPGGIFILASPGLVGVSADGADVFFSTFDTLAPQDHNGLFLKFYDARSGGGFSAPAPPPPCEAADECHGSSSESPSAVVDGTGAYLGQGGNVVKKKLHHRRKRAKRHRKRRSNGAHKRAKDATGRQAGRSGR